MREKTHTGIVPVGNLPDIVPKIIAANLLIRTGVKAEIFPSMELPENAYDPKRMQYNAGSLIKVLKKRFRDPEKLIAVCAEDLFIPIFAYVYGEAELGGKCAVISLYRLGKSPVSSSVIYERAVKVAIHETGHLFGLMHCEDRKCLMHFAGTPEELDEIRMDLCRYCLPLFRNARFSRTDESG